jgi:hypothetical protein
VVGGAVVGSIVGLALLGLAIFVLLRYCRSHRNAQQAFADLQFSSGGTADVELQLDPLPPSSPPQHPLQQQPSQSAVQQPERPQPSSSNADRTAGDEEDEPPPPPPPVAAKPGFAAGDQRAAQLQLQEEV